jgi:hypothetical protein
VTVQGRLFSRLIGQEQDADKFVIKLYAVGRRLSGGSRATENQKGREFHEREFREEDSLY